MADRAPDGANRMDTEVGNLHFAPRPKLPAGRTLLFRVLSIVIGLAVGCAILEGTLWLLDIGGTRLPTKRYLRNEEDKTVDYHCYPTNPQGEFANTPDVRLGGPWTYKNYMLPPRSVPLERIVDTPWCVEYRYSSQGLRDKEFAPFPSPGVLRIATIGDSFVFGEGVPVDRTLSRQMQSILGDGYEVMNCGRVGLDTEFELRLLLSIVSNYHCARAIFTFLVNDVKLTPELEKRQEYINDLIIIRDESAEKPGAGYLFPFRLPNLIRTHFAMRRITAQTIQWYLDSYDPSVNGANLARLEKQIQLLAKIPGCRVAFVIYPLLEGLEGDYPLSSVHEKIAIIAKSAGLPVLDLAPAFAGQRSSDLWVHDTDHHPNGRAHALAAGAIIDWLRREHPDFLELPVPPKEPFP